MPARAMRCGASPTSSRPSNSDAAAVGRVMAAHDVDERRLPRAVRSDQSEDLAAPHLELDVRERLHALERFRHVAHDEDRLGALPGGGCGRRGRCALRQRLAPSEPSEEALGQEQDDENEDQTQGGAAGHGVVARGEDVEEGGQRGRPERRTQPVARAAERGHQDDVEGGPARERLADRDVRNEDAVDAACDPGQRAGQRERRELEAIGRYAHHLGHFLVVVDGEEAGAEARAIHGVSDPDRRDGEREREQVERARGRRRELRQRHGAEVDARPAVDRRVEHDRRDDEGHREREQREQLAPQRAHPEDDGAERDRQSCRHGRREGQRPQERPVELAGEHRGRVDAGAEEPGVAEGEIARVPAQDVPRGGEDHPVEDEVEERFVERRQAEKRHCAEGDAGGDELHQNFSGRASRAAISRENETSGAQAGAATAMVRPSLTPITTPATSGPSGLPRPPIITTAKTTPTQA